MRWIKNVAAIALLVIVVMVGVIGQTDNADPLALRFLDYETPAVGTFWWLLVSFVLGAGAGFGICFFGFVRGKLTERRLKRSLDEQRRELEAVRVDRDVVRGENSAREV